MERRTLGLLWMVGLVGCGGAAPTVTAPPGVAAAKTQEAPAREAAAAPSPEERLAAARCARRHPGAGASRLDDARQGGAVALARLGGTTLAYAADADDDALHTFDVDGAAQLAVTPLPGAPAQILVLADGRVAATLADTNRVIVLEPGERADAPLTVLCDAEAPAEPWGLAATPDGARLVVTSGWGHALAVFDAGSLALQRRVPLSRDPRSVLVDDEGRRAYVTHMVGARMSVVDLAGAEPAVHAFALRPDSGGGAPGTQGFALARASVQQGAPARVFAPFTSVSPGRAEVSSTYGGAPDAVTVTPLVAVVDPVTQRVLGGERRTWSGSHRRECLLPRAAAVTPGGALLVACQGIDALVEMDGRSLDPVGVERRRFPVPSGPTGVAVDAARGRAVVWSQFARALAVVDLSATPPGGESAPLASAVLSVPAARKAEARFTAQEERGRVLFHAVDDTRISRDGRACASCHPDGRDDALTWSTPDGPRQTIMLAGRVAESAPYGWFGKNRTLRDHVRNSLIRLGGGGLHADKDRADLDALLAYVTAMRGPAAAGALTDPAHARRAARGREVYNDASVGCARCHFGGGADGERHDVQSGSRDEQSPRFDTPTLRFVGGTAPYFHDGRFATLEEMLEKADGRMGHTLHLSHDDLLSLAAYLEDL
jgi:DNA-binding beta-propeller fold protein YncE